MQLDKLIHSGQAGIPEIVVNSWKKIQGENLLPLQVLAISEYNLLKDESLLIVAPTSSGKTFCAELKAICSIFKRKKVIYLVPLKAIAEEKYADFCAKYSALGIKIAISTKDHPENDALIEKTDFDLCLMIYEKFNQLLVKKLDILKTIDLLIIDELQMLGDVQRGPVLELALTKVLSYPEKSQILALSAVLRKPQKLADYLGCNLLLQKHRPVELHQGVLLNGVFYYKEFNTHQIKETRFLSIQSEQAAAGGEPRLCREEILFASLEKMLEEDEQILVFVKSKLEAVNLALLFAERIKNSAAVETLQSLKNLESTSLFEKLLITLEKGIAFHNADLSWEERKIIQDGYLKKEIKILFCTTTLAMGVNLPAKRVFIETLKYQTGEATSKPVLIPISLSEYENMAGRAGRFGLEKSFGQAISIASSDFEKEALWEKYIMGLEETLLPQLDKINLEDVILDLVCSGIASDKTSLSKILNSTLTSQLIWKGQIPALDEKLNFLLEKNILLLKNEKLTYPEWSKICALKGISIKTGLALKEKLKNFPDNNLESWIFDLTSTLDGEKIYIPLTFNEQKNGFYKKILAGKIRSLNISHPQMQNLLDDPSLFTFSDLAKLKLSALLSDWTTTISTKKLEQKYHCFSGAIEQLAEKISWLLDSSFALATNLGANFKTRKFLRKTFWQIAYGVPKEGLFLAKLKIPSLSRGHILKLIQNNLFTRQQILERGSEKLETILPRTIAARLYERLTHPVRTQENNRLSSFNLSRPGLEKHFLVIDGSVCKNRFKIILQDKPVFLSGKSFKYLVRLALSVYQNPSGWIHKQDIEIGDNQTKYIFRLKNELKEYLPQEFQLIENDNCGKYRLNLSKQQIKFNLQTLGQMDDFELKEALAKLSFTPMSRDESASQRRGRFLSSPEGEDKGGVSFAGQTS